MQEKLLQRFLRYVAVPSQSNAANANVPSSEGQRKLAELLKQDLAELGLVDLEISEYSVLTGKLPAYLPEGCTKEVPAVGWCAHLDTIDINMSPEIHPQVVKNYQGGDVCLNKEKDIWIRTAEHPELEKYVGEDIVFRTVFKPTATIFKEQDTVNIQGENIGIYVDTSSIITMFTSPKG